MGDSPFPSSSSSFLPTPHAKKACSLPSLFLCIQQRPWLQVWSLISGILGCPVLKFWHSELGRGQRDVSLASHIGTSFTPLQMVSCVINAVVPGVVQWNVGRESMGFSGTIHWGGCDLCRFNSSDSFVLWRACSQDSSHKKALPPFEWKFTILEGEADHKFNLAD